MSNSSIADLPVSVEDYLAGEPLSEIRHEYLGGAIYAMAGASEAHNIIAMNLWVALGAPSARRALPSLWGRHEGPREPARRHVFLLS